MKKLIRINLIFLTIIFTVQTVYAGSYLFCTDGVNSKYAPAHLNSNLSWAPSDPNGYWLSGSLYIANTSKSLHSALKITLPESSSKRRNKRAIEGDYHDGAPNYSDNDLNSKNACDKLVNSCTNSFGNDYKYVGAASYDLAATDWGYVVVGNIMCPNWDFPRGIDFTRGYTAGEIIGENVLNIATSGPLPEKGINFGKPIGGIHETPIRPELDHPDIPENSIELNEISGNTNSNPRTPKIYSSKNFGKLDLTNVTLDDAIKITSENIGTTKTRNSKVKWSEEGFIYKGFTFRGDARNPEIIFEEGFKLRTPVTNENEVNGFVKGAAFGGGRNALDSGAAGVSTSPYYKDGSGVGAFYYAQSHNGYTYFIDARELTGYDLYSNSKAYEYGDKNPEYKKNPFHKPYEVNYGTDIPNNKIVGAFKLDGNFIPNPHYSIN